MIGLMNVQFAVRRDGEIHVLEVNPRASRTVPFVAKAIGLPIARVAARVMAGEALAASVSKNGPSATSRSRKPSSPSPGSRGST